MQKPVAMPSGGITIFLRVTAVRPSRTRQVSTPARPMRETTAVRTGVETMKLAFPFLLRTAAAPRCGSLQTAARGSEPHAHTSILIGWRDSEKRFEDFADN